MSEPTLNTILFVEDDPDIQAIARIALEVVGGFTVTVCGSGEEAVLAAQTCGFDLVLLDVMMPGMDGPETLKILRQRPEHERTPVIFLTAKVMKTDLAQLMELGAAGIIPKPFDPMQLPTQIREIWANVNQAGSQANLDPAGAPA